MFYQESYSCTMYKNNPLLIEEFDYYIGSMLREQAKMITISLVMDKLQIAKELTKQLLTYYHSVGVLEKQYCITCPTCGQVLYTVSQEEILDVLQESLYCIDCERDNIKCTEEDIFITFKRVKKSTASQGEINKSLLNHKVIDELSQDDMRFFGKADSLLREDILEICSQCDESAFDELNQLYKSLDYHYDNSTEQGKAYEKLAKRFLACIRWVDTTNILKTDTNQIDGFTVVYANTVFPSVYNVLSPVFYVECKNEPSKTPNITYVQKLFAIIMKSGVAKFGILFSRKKMTKEASTFCKQAFLSNQIAIINIYDDDLFNIINNRANILKYIFIRYAELISYAKDNIDLMNEFM